MRKRTILLTMISVISLIAAIFLVINTQANHTSDSNMPEVEKPYTITNVQDIQKLKNNTDINNMCQAYNASSMTVHFSNICVDAPIVEGLVKNNKAIVPDDASQTAWLNISSPLESEQGSTIIYGHVSHNNEKGALYNLHTMKAGDIVTTFDKNGHSKQWIVTGLENYNKKSIPTDLSNPQTTGERKLKIITCGGDFLGTHYEDNVVLTAVPL